MPLITFDNIILKPQFSNIDSRKEVDTSVDFLGFKLKLPLMAANMDTITNVATAKALFDVGSLAILHRYATPDIIVAWIKELKAMGVSPIIPSIGVQEGDLDNALRYQQAGADAICIDIAHGHCQRMFNMVNALKEFGLKIIAGNVATYEGVRDLMVLGVDAVKVGVGNGSNCQTRVVTGHGVPQISALHDAKRAKVEVNSTAAIISDGGVKNTGDICKALAAGADVVMSGSLFAGCQETPGDIVEKYGKMVKEYRGMASSEARSVMAKVGKDYMPEGVSRTVVLKGSVKDEVAQLISGIQSGLSYTGARNIKEFKEKAQYSEVSDAAFIEGLPVTMLGR